MVDPLDLLAAVGLLLFGVSLSEHDRLFHRAVPDLARQIIEVIGHGIALPLLIAFGVLLASADAVFAAMFRVHLDPASVGAHVVGLGLGAWGMAGLIRSSAATHTEPDLGRPWELGTTDIVIVLGSVVALFAVFAAAQLVALSEGGQRVIRTDG